MDIELKCNIINCRKKLAGQAFITSCSHIFCKTCAYQLFQKALVCPACSTSLPQASDIFLTDLRPSEEWKSMIISGLPPDTIMDICGRSLSFWVYQIFQEHNYQELLLKASDEKRSHAEKQLGMCISQAKSELSAVRNKCVELTRDLENEKKKHHDLIESNSEKAKQIKKLQGLCDKMKKKIANPQLGGMQDDLVSQSGDDAAAQRGLGIYNITTKMPTPLLENSQFKAPPGYQSGSFQGGSFQSPANSLKGQAYLQDMRSLFNGKENNASSSPFGLNRLFQTPRKTPVQKWSPTPSPRGPSGFFNHFSNMN